ncbi:MAG TPA: NADH:flavin oxidoreductase [Acidimicrobiaceae bacterium]|nr:NADH:flavin oxidoreductase [Acidimicrobiaceae bacterium]
MKRYPQVKNLGSPDALRTRAAELGIDLPVVDRIDADGSLAQPVTFTDGSAGPSTAPNRFAILPMEGWDGTTDGAPTDLVRRRWQRFGESGAGLVWGEATAVVPEGRANPNQLVIDERTVEAIAGLRQLLAPGQVAGLQLTHSGRWSRPDGTPHPRTALRHPVLDARVGADDATVLSDGELEALQARFVAGAVLVAEAGFDFVDIKCCHGYLLHELLAGRDRAGSFGGDLEGRTRFLRGVLAGIRAEAPGLAVAVRLSAFDFVPFRAGSDGVGEPDGDDELPRPFGADDSGLGIDLTETHALLDLLTAEGVGLVCSTAGSPYTTPHIQRPASFPPSDGYDPPEDPLVGVARQIVATAALTAAHPDLVVVGSGYSYLQDWLAHVGQAVVGSGGAHLVGLGRIALSYPTLPVDVLAGRPLERRLVCRTFSDCTTAPRAGLVSGCYPLDPYYRDRPERVELVQAKRRAREARR